MLTVLKFTTILGVIALLSAEAHAQQWYVGRPGPFAVPQPLPRPMIVPQLPQAQPRYQFQVAPTPYNVPRFPQPQWQIAGATPKYCIAGRCYTQR